MSKKILILLLAMTLVMSSVMIVSASTFEQDVTFNLTVGCDLINCSDGNVNLTLSDPDGLIIIDNLIMENHTGYVSYIIPASNVSQNGEYTYYVSSDTDYYYNTFTITPNGEEPNLTKGLIFFLCASATLCLLLMSIFGTFHLEHYMSKFALYWCSHLLAIAVTFMLWNGSLNFLTGHPFVVGFFRILWWVSMISVFPMILLSVAWMFYIHTVTKEMERLIDGGMSPEEAFMKTKPRRRLFS